MTPQELRSSILQLAIQGKLVEQRPEEGTAEELYQKIQKEKRQLIQEGKIKKEKPLPEIAEDEKPFEIPENWKWVRLGAIGLTHIGLTYSPKDISENGTIVLRSSNIQNSNMDYQDIIQVNMDIPASKMCHIGDILICARNGSKRLVGKAAIIDKEGMSFGAFMAIVRSRCNTYVLQVINSAYFRNSLLGNTGTTTINQITQDMLKNAMIPLPPLAEQERIVSKTEELLPYIDCYEQVWNRLEEFNKRFPVDMQKSLLQWAIQGKLVEQCPDEGTAEELYRQIQEEKQRLVKEGKIKKEKPMPEIAKDEVPFEIPESWKWVHIGSVCTNIQYGSSQKSSTTGKMIVLRMGNLQSGKVVYDKLVYTSDEQEIRKYPLQVGDLLFNRTNSKELVGKTAIYKGEYPAIYAGYLVRITPMLLNSDYLNFVMQTQYYWTYCQAVRSDAIGQSNINAEKLKHFAFPLPPLAEQKRIVAKLEELLPLCERLK